MAFVRAWGSGASASISFWERGFTSDGVSTDKESSLDKRHLPFLKGGRSDEAEFRGC